MDNQPSQISVADMLEIGMTEVQRNFNAIIGGLKEFNQSGLAVAATARALQELHALAAQQKQLEAQIKALRKVWEATEDWLDSREKPATPTEVADGALATVDDSIAEFNNHLMMVLAQAAKE
ncbi:hypothetical protein [Ralstonia phage phiRSL1]|uniref:Uncharacterized protein n=1 Tax=Ralstonia phage phiRSL1 TaxID=1980924 RepID=B2ZXP9_9CAUD|nr:hypothetical protein RSL1_ORF029 [Ralstonia phage phiRSL1]BAG41474.1 hypothetical protein [Ralstonia phage phiRSL1]